MAYRMTLTQARNIVNRTAPLGTTTPERRFTDFTLLGEDPPPYVPPGGTGGTGSGDVPAGFDEDTFGENADTGLPPGWVVNPATGGLIPPGGGEVQGPADEVGMGELFQVGDTVYRWNGTSITKATAAETRAFLDGGDGTGGGGVDTGPGYLDLANREFAFKTGTEFPFERDVTLRQLAQDDLSSDRTELGRRANAGLNLATLARGLANDAYDRAADPGNFPALLAAQAGITPAAGSSLTQLLGDNFQIEAENPLADQRFQDLYGDLFDYAGAMNADFDAVRRAYATDPVAAQRWFEAASAPKMATGGTFMVARPKRLQDLVTGKTDAVVGDAGPEIVNVDPIDDPTRFTGARAPAPAPSPIEGRRVSFAPPRYLGDIASGASGGAASPAAGAATGANAYTPASGTWTALGKALAPLGFVPRVVMARLAAGEAITPNMLGSWVNRLSPSQKALLLAATRAQVGSAGLQDYLFEADRYALPGFNGAAGRVLR